MLKRNLLLIIGALLMLSIPAYAIKLHDQNVLHYGPAGAYLTNGAARFNSVNYESKSFTAAPQSYVQASGLSAGITMTLPDASTCLGQEISLNNADGTYSVTPATVSSQTINGTTPAAVTHGNKAVYLSDGSNYIIE